MLAELRINNFAIIDTLELNFAPGLITFTGETGAGKSIIIDAVQLLLGGRADSSMIRTGAERAIVEATFRIPNSNQAAIQTILEREDLLDDPDYFTVGREVRLEGRSVARLNGRNVNAGLLKELGELLVDMHGQSEHLSLLRVKEHQKLLDRYANDEETLNSYAHLYQTLILVDRELIELRQAESESARQIDLLDYQINEINSAHLKIGEEDDLLAERNRLANAENLASLTQQALLKLDDGTAESPAVTDMLGEIMDDIEEIAILDSSQASLAEYLQNSFTTLTEISRELRNYSDGIEFNPARLEQVEERVELLSSLKRKYGGTIPAVLEYLETALEKKNKISNAEERIAELDKNRKILLIKLGEVGQALSEIRRNAAEKLEKEIEAELDELNMAGARFEVDFQQKQDPKGVPLSDGRFLSFDATGLEKIEFLIAPNPGEGLKPLVKIASGGETSRLMLALKNVLARADNLPTLIFDEIDQGIGGRIGTIVGHKLRLLSQHHQVLCVTHLPQLAAFGEQHLQVTKQVKDGRTITHVINLDENQRLSELAQMLGEKSDSTLLSARDMLVAAAEMTGKEHD